MKKQINHYFKTLQKLLNKKEYSEKNFFYLNST